MRRVSLVLFVVMLFSAVAMGGTHVAAQDATPAAGEAPIVVEMLASAPSMDMPGMMQVLLRATIAPGGVVPSHVHPGQILVVVESGTLTYTVLGGEGESVRGGAGTPTAAEAIEPGTEIMLGPGEWFVEHPAVVHTARNAGDEPTVLLVTGLVAADEPFLQAMDMATPAA